MVIAALIGGQLAFLDGWKPIRRPFNRIAGHIGASIVTVGLA